jgi:hypothetical protein
MSKHLKRLSKTGKADLLEKENDSIAEQPIRIVRRPDIVKKGRKPSKRKHNPPKGGKRPDSDSRKGGRKSKGR